MRNYDSVIEADREARDEARWELASCAGDERADFDWNDSDGSDFEHEHEHDMTYRMTVVGPEWSCADCGEPEDVDAPF